MRTTWISPAFLCLLATAPVAGQGRAEPNLRPGLQIVAQEERYVGEAETFQQMIAVLNGMGPGRGTRTAQPGPDAVQSLAAVEVSAGFGRVRDDLGGGGG